MGQTNGIATLLTDFGTADVYVGVMKGVMLQVNPRLTLVDLTHAIPAQHIASAAWQLQNAYRHFPPGTVHLVVVDPGVGSSRRAIALEAEGHFFVAPDNGVLSRAIAPQTVTAAIVLNRPQYWYTPTPSATFQGRDIFAAVAAHLASGVSLWDLGDPMAPETLVLLPAPQPERYAHGVRGQVQAIDQFGNVISTLSEADIAGNRWWAIVGGQVFPSAFTYSDVAWGEPLSLIGSHGWVELAVNGGNASQRFGLTLQDPIDVQWAHSPRDDLPYNGGIPHPPSST